MHLDRCNTSHNPLHANYSHPSGVKLVAPVSPQQGSEGGWCLEGVQCPLSLLTLGPVGTGKELWISKCPGGFHLWIKMWITLDRYRLWQHARIEIKGYQYNAQWKAGQPPKKDMLIMSEVGRSSLAFNARGTQCNSLFTSFCPACCHFICLLFFLDLSISKFMYGPSSSKAPSSWPLWDWDTDTAA